MRLALTNRSKLYSCSSQNDECRYGCQHLFHRLVTKPGPRLNMPRSVFRHFLTLVNNTKKWKRVHSLDTILYGLRLISHSSVGFRQMYKCILFCVKKKVLSVKVNFLQIITVDIRKYQRSSLLNVIPPEFGTSLN